jgi:hypothetical protein
MTCRACGHEARHNRHGCFGPGICRCTESDRQIAALRAGLEEIEVHDAWDEHAGWMANRAVAALKEAE